MPQAREIRGRETGISGAAEGTMYSEANLHRYLEESRRSRRGLSIGLAFATLLALLLSLSHPGVGVRMLGVIGIIAGAGFWILTSHINDWEGQLRRRNGQSR